MKKGKKPSEKKDRMCFNCRNRKPLKEMNDIGLWVCNTCLDEGNKKKKK